MFALVFVDIVGGEMTLAHFAISSYSIMKKDQNILNRINVTDVAEDYVRHGLNELLVEDVTGKCGVSPQTTNRI